MSESGEIEEAESELEVWSQIMERQAVARSKMSRCVMGLMGRVCSISLCKCGLFRATCALFIWTMYSTLGALYAL